jgi:hypothetical protein
MTKILKLILFIPLISFSQEKSETKSEYQIMLETSNLIQEIDNKI